VPTAEELTDPYVSTYVPPPPAGPGVCEVCHGWTGTRYDGSRYPVCLNCRGVIPRVNYPVLLVVPISLTRTDLEAQLHNVLRDYKYAGDPDVRARHTLQVAGLLARFLRSHRRCIENVAGDRYDTMTIVPSKRGRTGKHPLQRAIELVPDFADVYEPLLRPGAGEIGRRAPARDGFVATGAASGRAVLLVDDTLTSGAKLQSAAWALAEGGARVVGAVVLGRVIDPAFSEEAAALWTARQRLPFDFEQCCLE
jgi:hypothetical protein